MKKLVHICPKCGDNFSEWFLHCRGCGISQGSVEPMYLPESIYRKLVDRVRDWRKLCVKLED